MHTKTQKERRRRTGEEEEKLGRVGEEREMKRSKEAEGEKGGRSRKKTRRSRRSVASPPSPTLARAHARAHTPSLIEASKKPCETRLLEPKRASEPLQSWFTQLLGALGLPNW